MDWIKSLKKFLFGTPSAAATAELPRPVEGYFARPLTGIILSAERYAESIAASPHTAKSYFKIPPELEATVKQRMAPNANSALYVTPHDRRSELGKWMHRMRKLYYPIPTRRQIP